MKKRKKLRLEDYNYGNNGKYFITIVTHKRKPLLSKIEENNQLYLTGLGKLVDRSIHHMESQSISIDNHIIMPNHIHLIIGLEDSDQSLIEIIQNFKSYTSKKAKEIYSQNLWQRSYYDKIIRTETQYNAIYHYISLNPLNWNMDKYNSQAGK